jgi:ethanolamine ammonia-lyase small subunit
MPDAKAHVIDNPWQALRQFTDARIALGRTGISLPTHVQLDFQLAHARARDAVHQALDTAALAAGINRLMRDAGVTHADCLQLASAATSRSEYLQRPDLGRQLNVASDTLLLDLPQERGVAMRCDLAIVVADGLSALAIQQNTLPFLTALLPAVLKENWSIAPVCVVSQGRVAVGDVIGELLGAKMVVVLIGERPGLSSPDSMGIYMTWAPKRGTTDERRNCLSNIRPAGLPPDAAALKLWHLLKQGFLRQLTGVQLKDDTAHQDEKLTTPDRNHNGNFLLGPG